MVSGEKSDFLPTNLKSEDLGIIPKYVFWLASSSLLIFLHPHHNTAIL
jgi:hypothetical protein